MQMFWRIATTVSIVASVVSASITSLAGSVPAWPQWGQNPQHSGTAVAAGQDLNRILADLTFDPFVPQEIKAPCNFCTHYQAPLIDGRDVFMEFKTGTYSGEHPDLEREAASLAGRPARRAMELHHRLEARPEPVQRWVIADGTLGTQRMGAGLPRRTGGPLHLRAGGFRRCVEVE